MVMVKVKEINLERGFPTVPQAMRNLINDLSTAQRSGCKAAVIVHGYGSTGTGGAIKEAVKSKLKEPLLRGVVKETIPGEEWYSRKKEFLNYCPQLKDFSRYVDGNRGVTVALLR
ncbi:Smr/MutS family protein [Anaerovorax odorimutans]|uniref:Smr/MutS family protein n=1 Tax=Anaerovorax odorimutans TaxID=109327 RepID=A0ABT1RRE0_9FIRM|nr:Smr/MutS family protein [Anaerovorax odorimutans]MCQ4637757.1 Smr/MutS family protein [Anaerovorax odorimutans]